MQKNISIWLRTIAGIMLFAMLYYVAGYRVVSFLIMQSAKGDAAMAMKFDKASLQNLALNTAEYSKLKWIESGKEFSYNGQLYDVVSTSKTNGVNNVIVYADKNETRWAQALNDFVKQFFPSNSDTGKGMKTAEAMVSAFQKEYTPIGSLKVRFPSTEQVKYFSADREMICMASPTGIWHPPTQC